MYLIGFDIGSSSIKGALVHAETLETLEQVQSPNQEMEMIALQEGWAEQDPELWWTHVCQVSNDLIKLSGIDSNKIKGIGISYQMHGLVLVDEKKEPLRPSIIWCDSRAVDIGEKAFNAIGKNYCLANYLNSPGNFTASKLKWVKENEAGLFNSIYKFMLPGDYIAMKMTSQIKTTITGLSEGILWNYKEHKAAIKLLNHYDIPQQLLPNLCDSIAHQGSLTALAAKDLGLKEGTPLTYRAGDQANNAMALGVLNPGEVAATGGTSGVVYAVLDKYMYDEASRINSFVHVNHEEQRKRLGLLLCINGVGCQYAWIKNQIAAEGIPYHEMETKADQVSIGAEGLRILPFGNGAERMLNNRQIGAHIINLQFNTHRKAHLYRAALEGIAFAFYYGIKILQTLGLNIEVLKVGNDNLFQSKIFTTTLSNLINAPIEIIQTNGAIGAAKAASVALGLHPNIEAVFSKNKVLANTKPNDDRAAHKAVYQIWEKDLALILNKKS